jgi:hypothetical protein
MLGRRVVADCSVRPRTSRRSSGTDGAVVGIKPRPHCSCIGISAGSLVKPLRKSEILSRSLLGAPLRCAAPVRVRGAAHTRLPAVGPVAVVGIATVVRVSRLTGPLGAPRMGAMIGKALTLLQRLIMVMGVVLPVTLGPRSDLPVGGGRPSREFGPIAKTCEAGAVNLRNRTDRRPASLRTETSWSRRLRCKSRLHRCHLKRRFPTGKLRPRGSRRWHPHGTGS